MCFIIGCTCVCEQAEQPRNKAACFLETSPTGSNGVIFGRLGTMLEFSE
jgi:hypothetical protein